MDINEDMIKEEVSSFVHSLQKLLPKKKEIIVIEKQKPKLIRLSDVHAEAKSVFPACFTGAKLVVLREVMDKVKLVQQYNFGKAKDSYKCFTHVIHKELEPKSSNEGLLVDSAGSATATYSEILDGTYQMRLTSKIKDLVSSETEMVIEKEQEKSVGSLSCCVKDVDPNTLKLVTQWTYKIIPEFSLGTEVSCRPLSSPTSPDLSISARYEKPSFTLSSTISRSGFQACLFKQFSPDLRIATIVNERTQGHTAIGVALHKKYQNGSELKIFVDSQHCGGFTFQKDVLFHEPHNEVRVLRLIGSTLIDRQRRVRFGFGFNLDF
ncbi:mitochondrial import receptor subunit TOM40 homolog [Ostrinia nubilalis]|uniref:mitochondrial import receptor subunit TOM40 homolog n=1 Tax=Ostrinia furnacalis TaxID=93504 RepID=UPI001038BD9B|nr:mitochondrial import receptor subunit TOM40 homolog [Ostrinia furnacalis]